MENRINAPAVQIEINRLTQTSFRKLQIAGIIFEEPKEVDAMEVNALVGVGEEWEQKGHQCNDQSTYSVV